MDIRITMIACLPLVVQGVSAQTAAPVAVSVQQAVAGPSVLAITNTSSKTITAIVFVGETVVKPGAKTGVRIGISPLKIYDAATEPRAAKPIPPGRSSSIPQPPLFNNAGIPPAIRAVIFADGTSWGDTKWVSRVLQRRDYMERQLGETIATLAKALDQGISREQLVGESTQALAETLAGAADADEAAFIRSTRGLVLQNLERTTHRADGELLTTSDVIRHEIEALAARLASIYGNSIAGPAVGITDGVK